MSIQGKVIFVGDSQVGKTSLINSYRKKFSADTAPTIGALSHRVVVNVAETGDVELNVWDTAGQEEYKSFVPMFARGAEVAVLVFDLSRRLTFEHLEGWLSFFQEGGLQSCRIIVAGNTSDLPEQKVEEKDTGAFMAEHEGLQCFWVSAKNGACVDELFCEAARCVTVGNPPTTKQVRLAQPPILSEKREKGCC